jgi:hypothetical protein
MLSWTKVWLLFAVVGCLLVPSMALAQKPVTVHVIALDSDDASEDQADALTAALRQRVRNTPSLQLAESNQSLATLLPALKCPTRPDSACLQRIGDQLRTDRFFWGNVVKAGVPHQVVAEVHLWTRGKPEQVAKESYSDNLKDQNDDALKRVAVQLFDHLTGQATQGTIVVHANGSQVGTVIVDGKPVAQLDHGQATLPLGSGTHTVDLQVSGMTTSPQDVSVVVNVQSEITFELKASALPPVEPSKPGHPKRTVGFIMLGVAGASAIVGAVFGGLYAGNAGTFNGFRNGILNDPDNAHICTAPTPTVQGAIVNGTSWRQACGDNGTGGARGDALTDSIVAWTLGGAAVGLAVIGAILVATDHSKEEGAPPPASARLQILPSFGPTGGGLSALLTF